MDAVIDAVDRAELYDRAKFTGWNHSMLCRLKASRPDATIGLFTQRPQSWMNETVFEQYVLGTAETADFDAVHVYAGAITTSIADGLRDRHCVAHANDAVDRDDVQRAMEAEAFSMSANDVAMAMSVVGT